MKYSSFLALAGLVGGALATNVVQLTTDAFEDFVSENEVVMVEFYAPWCGHCKALAPEYEVAATKLKEHGIPVTKVDCTEEEALCAQQKIQGYPTIKVFHGLDNDTPYPGGRTSDAIVSYMLRQSRPAVSEVSAASVDDFKTSDKVAVLGFFDDKKSNTTFGNLAESLRDRYSFGASGDKALAKKLGVKSLPGAVVFKNFDNEVDSAVFDGEKFNQKSLKSFVSREAFPTLGELGPNNYNDYVASELPLLYVFWDDAEDKEELSEILRPLASKLKGKAHIGFIDANAYGSHAQNVNIRQEWPAIVIQDFSNNAKFPMSQDEPLTKEAITEFVTAFASGKLEPTLRSAPIPEQQGSGAYTLVGKEYNKVVIDNDKDVLVEFYAPWCGHCKNLAPTYAQLGDLFKDDDRVTVAQLDHTENEVPLDIRGYPTIKLFPAGKKDSPIDFTGARTLEGLVNFIKTEGTHKVDGLAKRAVEADDEDEDDVEDDEDEVSHEDL